MSFGYRRSFRAFDWLRFNLNKKSASATARLGPITHTRSSTGRRSTSIRLPGGFTWRRSRRGDSR